MEHLKNYWWAYLILIIAAYFGIKWYNKNKALKINTDSSPVEGSPCVKTQSCKPGDPSLPIGFMCPPGGSWSENGIWKDGKCDTRITRDEAVKIVNELINVKAKILELETKQYDLLMSQQDNNGSMSVQKTIYSDEILALKIKIQPLQDILRKNHYGLCMDNFPPNSIMKDVPIVDLLNKERCPRVSYTGY